MSTELELAKGSPRVFTKTSNDVSGCTDTSEFLDIIDTMDIQLPARNLPQKSYLLMISYYLQIEIPSPAENENQSETVFILCTLDPTSADLLTGGVDCKPSGVEGGDGTGTARGVPFGSNNGLNTGYHGAHSFTWVEKVTGGSHKIVMRAMFGFIILGGQNPSGIQGPKINKRTLVVQAFPI